MKVPTPFSRPSTRFIKHYMMLWLRRAFERERPASWSAKRALEAYVAATHRPISSASPACLVARVAYGDFGG